MHRLLLRPRRRLELRGGERPLRCHSAPYTTLHARKHLCSYRQGCESKRRSQYSRPAAATALPARHLGCAAIAALPHCASTQLTNNPGTLERPSALRHLATPAACAWSQPRGASAPPCSQALANATACRVFAFDPTETSPPVHLPGPVAFAPYAAGPSDGTVPEPTVFGRSWRRDRRTGAGAIRLVTSPDPSLDPLTALASTLH